MKTPLENSLSLAFTYSSGEQYSLSVARSAPPKLFSAGTPSGRGGRLDAHERHLYLIFRLACEVADSRRDFQARAQDARGESLALRRVIPSPKERRRTQMRPLKVCVKPLRISARKTSPKERLQVQTARSPSVGKIIYHFPCACFVKEWHRKILRAMPAKFFAPLTTTAS